MRVRGQLRRLLYATTTVVAAIVFMLSTALTAWAAESMTLTFVRHGESEANAAGIIDTSVPGPHLTKLGQQQAAAVADALAGNNYDGVYASSMIRTQETAQPLATQLGQQTVVLPGLREIDAGVFEGQSEDSGLGRIGYVLAPLAWTLGARFVPVLGSTDGNAFDARVDDAIQTIYTSGDRNAVVFSHGATIMFWTMMNVDNPDLGLILSHPLDNTSVVVITGNPEDGWTLENWDGVEVAAEPSLPTKLFVDVRNVVTAPQTALYRIGQAFAAGDIAGLANAIRNGVVDVATKVVGFVPKVVGDIVGSLQNSATVQSAKQATTGVETVTASASSTLTSSKHDEGASATGDSDSAKKTTAVATKPEKTNGATDLSDGNKAEPGQTATTTTGKDADNDSADVVPITDATKEADGSESSDGGATKTDSDSEGSQQAAA